MNLACKKRPPKNKDKDPLDDENLSWLDIQDFEDLEITSQDGLKLKAKLIKGSS